MELIIWLALVVVFAIVEAIILDLTSIWFSFGALIALIVSIFVDSFIVQFIVFALASLLFLILLKPTATKYLLKNKTNTNISRIIGERAIVVEDIGEQGGAVKVEGKVWTAKSIVQDEIILRNEKVEVLEIRGSKVIVKKI